jgi:hypothetical protein
MSRSLPQGMHFAHLIRTYNGLTCDKYLKGVLDYHPLRQSTVGLLQALCRKNNTLPSQLSIDNFSYDPRQLKHRTATSDLYLGCFDGRPVAVKKLRLNAKSRKVLSPLFLAAIRLMLNDSISFEKLSHGVTFNTRTSWSSLVFELTWTPPTTRCSFLVGCNMKP